MDFDSAMAVVARANKAARAATSLTPKDEPTAEQTRKFKVVTRREQWRSLGPGAALQHHR